VRPVVADEGDEPAKASREEAIWEEQGLLTVAGGKLTTWRLTAEEAVDLALRHLPPEVARKAAPCATASTPLAGHAPATFGDRLASFYGAPPEVARAMTRRLGALAWTACELWREPAELRPLADGLDLCAAELRAHLRFGAVLHLSDLLLRRVRLGMWRPGDVESFLPALEPAIREAAGWDAKRWDDERERYARDVRGWTLAGVAKEGRR
jgi:glycerol-3-phosphate dehydrogenase